MIIYFCNEDTQVKTGSDTHAHAVVDTVMEDCIAFLRTESYAPAKAATWTVMIGSCVRPCSRGGAGVGDRCRGGAGSDTHAHAVVDTVMEDCIVFLRTESYAPTKAATWTVMIGSCVWPYSWGGAGVGDRCRGR